MTNVRTNERASSLGGAGEGGAGKALSICILLHSPALSHAAHARRTSARRFVYHCCSLLADLFQKSEGERERKQTEGGLRERDMAEGGRGRIGEGGRRRHIDGCGFHEIGLSRFNVMCKTSEKATLFRRERRNEGERDSRKGGMQTEGGRGREREGGNDSRQSARAWRGASDRASISI